MTDCQPIKGAVHPVSHKGLLELALVTINMSNGKFPFKRNVKEYNQTRNL